MLKITAIISLFLIVTWSHAISNRYKKDADDTSSDFEPGGIFASSLSCDSCGSECLSACGTRHFRACCFNYLRRKRGNSIHDNFKILSTKSHEDKKAFKKFPLYSMDSIPDFSYVPSVLLAGDFDPNAVEDKIDGHYQIYYED